MDKNRNEEVQLRSNKKLSEGWIKVQGKFASPRKCDAVQADSTAATISENSAINKAILKDAAPKLCVSLLRHPSSIIYINIHQRIVEADNSWLEGFFREDGLNVLFEMLEQLTDTKQFNASSLSNFVLPMFCVECIKAVIKNDRSMDLIVSVPDYAYKLVQVIDSDSFAVRSNTVQLLSALAYYSERGCQVTLEALEKFQHDKCKMYWTKVLVEELKAENSEYQASLMALINCILLNVDFDQRIKLRNELLAVGLCDLLSKLDKQSLVSERLSVQLGLFYKYKNQDDSDLEQNVGSTRNVDNPYDLFDTIMKKFERTPQSMKFLTVLQYLSLVESDNSLTDRQWDIIEQFLSKILSIDVNQQSVINHIDKIEEIINRNSNSFTVFSRSSQTDEDELNQKLKRNIQNITSMIIRRKPATSTMTATSKNVSKATAQITQMSSARIILKQNSSDKIKPVVVTNSVTSAKSTDNSVGLGNNQKKPVVTSNPLKKNLKNPVTLSSIAVPKNKGSVGRKMSRPILPNKNVRQPTAIPTKDRNSVKSGAELAESKLHSPTVHSKQSAQLPVPLSPSSAAQLKLTPPPPPPHPPPLTPGPVRHTPMPPPQPTQAVGQDCPPQPPPLPTGHVPCPPPPPPLPLPGGQIHAPPPPPPPPPPRGLPPSPPLDGQVRGPPAPPSGNIATTCPPINERYSTFPRQKCKKTKIVHWNKVVPLVLHQRRNSLWTQSVDIPVDNVNLLQLEDLFSTETTVLKVESFDEKETSSVTKIYILDQKTSLKISLLLKQFRTLNVDQIVKLVLDNAKENEISIDKLRGLQRCMASDQDVVNVMNFEGDRNKLGLAEKFVWHVGQHATFGLRLEIMCLQREFDEKFKTFTASFDFLTTCCNSLVINESLKKFLFLILHIGNYLNLGSSSGPAAGFKISSVKQLAGLKATSKCNTTLLHVTVESAQSLDIAMLNFIDELSAIHTAVKTDFETLKNEAITYSNDVKKLHAFVLDTKDKVFIEQVDEFFKNAKILLSELDMKIATVEMCAKNIQEYFCDDLKLSDMISLLSEFVKSVDRAKIEIEQRRLREERSAKYNEQQLLKKQNRQSVQTLDETNLVESLLTQIREGDIKPRANAFLTDEQKEKARRKSRNVVRKILVEQSRDRM